MTNKRVVLTTCGSIEEAKTIAHALVERRLAACVNIVPGVESVYRWKDSTESANELLLVIKTVAELFPCVQSAIREMHSYEIPECVEIPITDGSEKYLKWIEESVK